ncbi:MAG: hypothetical protein A2Y17_04260 [Clostridiales bacterium GWF2_38_85]|nr:MAG: hypothetical protein A2Y17_04260 [Clostridiales bacterium GWF2_38_85]HBL83435.1 hypothetical protein [Clostridiales bacterium]
MFIKTKDFKNVEINENDIIKFPQGIYGYEDVKNYVVLNNPDNQWMMHLQSVEDENPRFILLDPFMFIENYLPVLPEGTLELLQAKKHDEINILVVAVIPASVKDITINLKSPVIINFEKKIAAQIILENRDYSVRTRLFPAEKGISERVV